SLAIRSSNAERLTPAFRASASRPIFVSVETRQLYTSVFMHYSVVHLLDSCQPCLQMAYYVLGMRIIVLFVTLLSICSAQTYKPSEANLKARQWFQDSKFGLFIHWGVYSTLGEGEWVMNNKKMSIAEYEPLAARFNPAEFDAAEWVRLAKSAGMKYIT